MNDRSVYGTGLHTHSVLVTSECTSACLMSLDEDANNRGSSSAALIMVIDAIDDSDKAIACFQSREAGEEHGRAR